MKRVSPETSGVFLKIAPYIWHGKTCVLVGAGISTSCGIPDFRSKQGIFQEIKKTSKCSGEDMFSVPYINSGPEALDKHLEVLARLKSQAEEASPSPTHGLLACISEKYNASIYTQNIDGLEEKAGIKKGLIYLHGSLSKLVCTYCSHRTQYTLELNQAILREKRAACPRCSERALERQRSGKRPVPVGVLRPDIVLYGEHRDTTETIRKIEKDRGCVLLLVMGTSLRVHGVRNLVISLGKKARANNGTGIYVGREAPPRTLESCFDYWVQGDCDDFSNGLTSVIQGEYMMHELKRLSLGGVQRLSVTGLEEVLLGLRRMSVECGRL